MSNKRTYTYKTSNVFYSIAFCPCYMAAYNQQTFLFDHQLRAVAEYQGRATFPHTSRQLAILTLRTFLLTSIEPDKFTWTRTVTKTAEF